MPNWYCQLLKLLGRLETWCTGTVCTAADQFEQFNSKKAYSLLILFPIICELPHSIQLVSLKVKQAYCAASAVLFISEDHLPIKADQTATNGH